jgi:hypothetical protein
VQKQEVPKTSFGDLIGNGAKTISLQTLFGDLIIIIRNRTKTMSHKLRLGDIIIIIRRNGAKTRSPQNFLWGLNNKKRSKHNMSPKVCLGGHNYSKS